MTQKKDDPEERRPRRKMTQKKDDPEESTHNTSNTSALTREMARYIRIATQPLKCNPLDWWRDERKQFPELAKAAHLVLAVPASSAPTDQKSFFQNLEECVPRKEHT